MVSVCMAVKNGEVYLEEQVLSILPQLGADDELIISDDHSTDSTRSIVESLEDERIRYFTNPGKGVVSNFENALKHSRGDNIFLSDQDDVWHEEKIHNMNTVLESYDLVVCDCHIVDKNLIPERESYFARLNSGKGILKNLMRNTYVGCCMAFRRNVLERALPFPKNVAMHDQWIGLVAEINGSVFFLDEKLVYHRRHAANTSTTFGLSHNSLTRKVSMRYHLIKNLLKASNG